MKKLFAWFVGEFDAGDGVFVVGLGVMSYGIYLLSPAWAFIVAGACLMLTAYAGTAVRLLATLLAARGQKR
jgi:hypothetical protein